MVLVALVEGIKVQMDGEGGDEAMAQVKVARRTER